MTGIGGLIAVQAIVYFHTKALHTIKQSTSQ